MLHSTTPICTWGKYIDGVDFIDDIIIHKSVSFQPELRYIVQFMGYDIIVNGIGIITKFTMLYVHTLYALRFYFELEKILAVSHTINLSKLLEEI